MYFIVLILGFSTICHAANYPGISNLDIITCDISYEIYDEHPYYYYQENRGNDPYLLWDYNLNNTECYTKCYNISDELLHMVPDPNHYTSLNDFRDYTRELINPNLDLNKTEFCKRDIMCCSNIQYVNFIRVWNQTEKQSYRPSLGLMGFEDTLTCDINYTIVDDKMQITFNLNYSECFSKCYNMPNELLEMNPLKNPNTNWGNFKRLVREHMHNVSKEDFCDRDEICCSSFDYSEYTLVDINYSNESSISFTMILGMITGLLVMYHDYSKR